MKNALTALVIIMFALSAVACGPSLEDAFSDVEESAPSLCKDYCEAQWDCQFDDDDYDGDAKDIDRIYDNGIKECIVGCSYPVSEGSYIREWDSTNMEWEIERWVSGGEYETFLQCFDNIWNEFDDDFLDCDDNDNFVVVLDDEDVCSAVEECYDSLDDLDADCSWDDALNFCTCDFDNELADGPF